MTSGGAAQAKALTLLTPVKNGMPWLPRAIASVAAQRREGVSVEHIVLDGGSTDGSREWLTDWRQREQPPDTELVFEPDAGMVDALTRGFSRARGEVLGWLNADDELLEGALGRVLAAFAAHPEAALVAGTCLLVDEDGRPFARNAPAHADFAGLLRARSGPAQPATFFRASAYAEAGGFDATYRLVFDTDLFLRIARAHPVVVIPDVLARFCVRTGSLSGTAPARAAREELDVRRRLGLPLTSLSSAVFLTRAYVYPLVPRALLAGARALKRELSRRREGAR